MDEWEDRKSMKQNKKFGTGHTYRRVSNRDVIRLNKDQNIKINDEIQALSSSYKGVSVNKGKNWLLKEKLLSTTNDEIFFDKEPKTERKKKANSKKFVETPVWDHLEPIVKVEKDHSNNKLRHNYVFYNPQSQKVDQEEDETADKKKSKVLSRKAQRKLNMKKMDDANPNENNYKETIKFSIEAPLETLKPGKCWKHPLKLWKTTSTLYTDDNRYSHSHVCEVISTTKHNTQKKKLGLDDAKCIAKDYFKYDQMKHARTAITYLSRHVNDDNTLFRPLIGLESYVDRDEVVKNFTREFHNVTTKPLTEEDGFYVCTSSDWQIEPTTVCQICLNDSPNELIKLDGCQHEACRKCWRHYVRSMIKSFDLYSKSNLNDQSIICCLHQGCNSSLTMDLISKILSPFEIKKYIKFYCDLKILNNQAYVECKRESCKRLILKSENSEISVCKCNYMICNKCDFEAHYPISCQDAMLYNTFCNSSSDSEVRFFVQGKFCPNCHMFIEKDGGCEHMHCFCKYDFCWECLRDYERGHLCTPGSKVRLSTLSMFSMDKVIKSKLVNVIKSIESILLDSQKRLAAANMIYTKLRLNPVDTDKIRLDYNEENDSNLQVESSNLDQQGSLELIYSFLRKISNDIEQFNTICKYAAFEVIVKKNDSISLHVYTAVQLCETINKLFLKVENWKHLNQLFTAYRKLMIVISKINLPTQF